MASPRIDQVTKTVQEFFNREDQKGAALFLEERLDDAGITPDDRLRLLSSVARIRYYAGDHAEARRLFLDALREDPSDFYVRFYLGRLAEAADDPETALRLYAELLREHPDAQQVVDHLTAVASSKPYRDPAVSEILSKRPPGGPVAAALMPKVSVLVLCYNKADYTKRCLDALFANSQYPNMEVVVTDNASADETWAMLETYSRRVTFVRSPSNLGFIGGNNLGFNHCTGEYVVFLNNDTEVRPGWLPELVNCFLRDPRVGAAGSMLLFPDGSLQEAGGAVFRDASGWNYGRGCKPAQSTFSFVREVDYCSGAALMVRSDIFAKIGGYDERFAPAYFEDTDICFSIRKLGYKVVFCPSSQVTHNEGTTNGTDVTKGMKRYQVINAPKFREKWANELALQQANDPQNAYLFSNRNRGKRILIIDDLPPLPDRASGSLKMYHTVKQMVGLGYQVMYVHLVGAAFDESARKHMKALRDLGVELHWFEYEVWWEFRDRPEVRPRLERLMRTLEIPKRKFDLAYICFWHVGSYFLDMIREEDPRLPIVVDSVDLHYVRERRQAEITKDPAIAKRAAETRRRELQVYSKADAVATVTLRDRETLMEDLPDKPVFLMTEVHDPFHSARTFEERADFLFVGNFNHNPNEDAVLWFVETIFPLIRKRLPSARFLIVGNRPTPKVLALASDSVIVTGWVPEVKPYLERCRVFVTPLRFGAGSKGKVGESLCHGLPMVSTTIGAEGMGIVHDEHAFVTDDPRTFADFAVRLYEERETWERFAVNGKALIGSAYSSALLRRRIEFLTSFAERAAFRSSRAFGWGTPPTVSIVIPVFNQWEYTKQCLESIRAFTKVNHEVVVIDNASTDRTLKGLREFPEVRIVENTQNVGFPGAINQGINAALGEHILILNNDTIVTEGWLDRMLEVACSHPRIGIVGPVSNSVSGVQLDEEANYHDIPAMHRYAAARRVERSGRIGEFPRVAFLCTLIKRQVIDAIGGLDERFAPGNYEDDDFCLRSNTAGFQTVVALDVFIHHFGSKSFKARGEQAYLARLAENRDRFVAKWGATPDDIWIRNASHAGRSTMIPLHRDPFIQHFERARILLSEREIAPGAAALREAILVYHESPREKYPVEFSDVLSLAGTTEFMLGNLDEAKEYFEKELRLTPASVRACIGLARVFNAAGMSESAQAMYSAAQALAPDNTGIAAESEQARGAVVTEEVA